MGDTRQLLLRCSNTILHGLDDNCSCVVLTPSIHGLVGSNNRKKPLNLSAISILATCLTDFLRINIILHRVILTFYPVRLVFDPVIPLARVTFSVILSLGYWLSKPFASLISICPDLSLTTLI